ncbi:Protein of unknown function [Pyronema omphalodes CBS 100304]|uniref:Uncharacterized protein n=1 Tax=Pyronema omphalodes (strain CBS 100304) TaxID=1076935 RepID=U4LSH6_PYROM|nr:Protein of unknown function [Pyronema omphalodes CBS 100304]
MAKALKKKSPLYFGELISTRGHYKIDGTDDTIPLLPSDIDSPPLPTQPVVYSPISPKHRIEYYSLPIEEMGFFKFPLGKKKASQQTSDNPAEQASDKTTEQPSEQETMPDQQNSDKTAEQSTDKTSKQAAEETPKQAANNTPEKAAEQAIMPVQQSTDSAHEATSEPPSESALAPAPSSPVLEWPAEYLKHPYYKGFKGIDDEGLFNLIKEDLRAREQATVENNNEEAASSVKDSGYSETPKSPSLSSKKKRKNMKKAKKSSEVKPEPEPEVSAPVIAPKAESFDPKDALSASKVLANAPKALSADSKALSADSKALSTAPKAISAAPKNPYSAPKAPSPAAARTGSLSIISATRLPPGSANKNIRNEACRRLHALDPAALTALLSVESEAIKDGDAITPVANIAAKIKRFEQQKSALDKYCENYHKLSANPTIVVTESDDENDKDEEEQNFGSFSLNNANQPRGLWENRRYVEAYQRARLFMECDKLKERHETTWADAYETSETGRSAQDIKKAKDIAEEASKAYSDSLSNAVMLTKTLFAAAEEEEEIRVAMAEKKREKRKKQEALRKKKKNEAKKIQKEKLAEIKTEEEQRKTDEQMEGDKKLVVQLMMEDAKEFKQEAVGGKWSKEKLEMHIHAAKKRLKELEKLKRDTIEHIEYMEEVLVTYD